MLANEKKWNSKSLGYRPKSKHFFGSNKKYPGNGYGTLIARNIKSKTSQKIIRYQAFEEKI